MKPDEFRTERLNRGWSQHEAARRLGVTQPYVVMLEKGRRPLTDKLVRKVTSVYKLSPVVLPLPETSVPGRLEPQRLAEDLASLGYPGYAYLHSNAPKKNPSQVLVAALAQNSLESRLIESLPWLLLQYWNMNFSWLVLQAKKRDLQNRLGFVVSLARRMSERGRNEERTRVLREVETTLDCSRLVREDDFLKPHNHVEREWLSQNRSEEAKHWNLLTDLKPDHLGYTA